MYVGKIRAMSKRVVWGLVLLAVVVLFSGVTVKAEGINPSNPLTFMAVDGPAEITFNCVGSVYVKTPTDTEYKGYTSGNKISLEKGERVSFCGNNIKTDKDKHFEMTGKISASGSVTSLIDCDGGNSEVELSEKCFASMFRDCKSLITAPELPATTLADYCYNYMFYGCTSLITAPELPATTLADYCYSCMFSGCTSLETAPALPATTLADHCYYAMFRGCTSLETAPALPATTLADYCYYCMFVECTSLEETPLLSASSLKEACYYAMFKGCTSLKKAKAIPAISLAKDCCGEMFDECYSLVDVPKSLPATTLSEGCYKEMFYRCTSLERAPELPATSLENDCYQNMFHSCVSLKEAPIILPASKLKRNCYNNMFSNCTSLEDVPVISAQTLGTYCCRGMFSGCVKILVAKNPVDDLGICFERKLPSSSTETAAYSDMFSGCGEALSDDERLPSSFRGGTFYTLLPREITVKPNANYLTLTAVDGPASISFKWVEMNNKVYVLKANAEELERYYEGTLIELEEGESVKFCADGIRTDYYNHFVMTGKIKVSGSVTSLLDKDGSDSNVLLPNDCFSYMFFNCTSLVEAPELPANILSNNCYYGMFSGCTALKTAPLLSATELADNCYYDMFNGCTSLMEVPDLPAVSLKPDCYGRMFKDCISLKTAPSMFATSLANNCCCDMFAGCVSLEKAPSLQATKLAPDCYKRMFSCCISLADAPVLPASTLTNSCYESMFVGCISLQLMPELPAKKMADYCYKNMFANCPQLRVAKKPVDDLFIECEWKLPDASNVTDAYKDMFRCNTASVVPGDAVMEHTPVGGTYYVAKTLFKNNAEKKANVIIAKNQIKEIKKTKQNVNLNATANGGATLSYKSSDKKVKVSSTGTVTIPKKYYGTVRITILSAETEEYKPATITVTITVTSAKPKINKAIAGKKAFTLRWKKANYADGYEIIYSTDKNFTKPKKVTAKKATTAVTVKKLNAGKTYYVKIRSFKKKGSKKIYSDYSAAKSVKTKK